MKIPVIAIVGRPNVGKSTLFNRFTRSQKAITSPEPGVTRDRHLEIAEWNAKQAMIMDTGGWVPKSADLFESAIREQVRYGIEECDLVMFVTDAHVGVVDMDIEIARMLQRSSKPVVVVVNKVDGPKQDSEVPAFYALGLGEPLPASGISGRGVAEVMDLLWSRLPVVDSEETVRARPLVAIVGRPNVGKSSLVNCLLGEARHLVTEIAGTTRDAIDSEVGFYKERLTLIDTAGLRRQSKVEEAVEFYTSVRTRRALEECDVAVVLSDASDGLVSQDIKVLEEATGLGKGVLLAVNKWDLIEKDSLTADKMKRKIEEKISTFGYVPKMFISSTERTRVHKVLEVVIRIYEERRKRISTPELNRWLQDLMDTTPPPSYRGRDLRIHFMSQPGTEPPLFVFMLHHPEHMASHYRKFLERKLREQYGFEGVPIRLAFRKPSSKAN